MYIKGYNSTEIKTTMKRKYSQIVTKINHEYYLTIHRETTYNDQQEIVYCSQKSTFEYKPRKRIKMSKKRNSQSDNTIVKRAKTVIDVLEETKFMTSTEKGRWFERKVNEKLKENGMITTPSSDGYYDKRNGYIMTGDGGIDISGQYREKSFIVQCKCHKEPIPASVIREMKGLIATRENTLGIICAVTFSQNAKNEAENSNGKIILTTVNDIVEQIQTVTSQNYSAKQTKMVYQEANEIEFTKNYIRMKNVRNGEINFQYN
jgi:hypothetical protein